MTILLCLILACNADAECDDGNAQTEDLCLIDHACGYLPMCQAALDCDDGNACTTEVCVAGGHCLYYPAVCDPCPADLTNDQIVDMNDLARLLGDWEETGPGRPEDLNHDDVIDANDLGIMLGAWGSC